MEDRPRYVSGQRFGDWKLTQFLRRGGNGEVWVAESDQGSPHAIKVLHSFGGDRYERFRREVDVLEGLEAASLAVLPLVDAHLPAKPSRKDPPWLVMPLATGITEVLASASVAEKVEAARQIAAT